MDYRNADGSLAQMCGNGVRATAAVLDALGLFGHDPLSAVEIDTRAGVKKVTRDGADFRVDMGPWAADSTKSIFTAHGHGARFVDMGNEHLVAVLRDPADLGELDLRGLPVVDFSNASLPDQPSIHRVKEAGANFEFITVSPETAQIKMRVYERGVGETLSCGTGVCAAAICGYLESGKNAGKWAVEVPGGQLRVEVEPERVVLTGPARIVAEVRINQEVLK